MDSNGGGGGAKSTIRSQILNLKERDSDLLSKPPSSFPTRKKRECRKRHNRGSREAQPSTTKNPPPRSSPSLVSDWNAYAASQESDSSAPVSDLEAAVRTTSGKVSGTFNVVSKGVRDIPGSFQSSTINVPSGQSFVYFGILLAAGVFFVFIAFTMFLPVMVLVPQKFAICFTIGCALIVASFFALKGPKNQLAHMFSKERLPFTLGFISTMVGTVYVSMVLHSYILSVLFSVLQVLALSYYASLEDLLG